MTHRAFQHAFTSVALPLAVGFTLLPLIRRLGEGNVIGDVIFPKIDQAGDLAELFSRPLRRRQLIRPGLHPRSPDPTVHA